ncbi:helix-turn-helix transcriptional regulator [Actinocrispum sp. NPDC049592]|uniref:helix-turn-helix transcriptional regulator n=1 Tax=Actinocrispum sp. NPDC049592 TaxID=3154835 RepID=UPI00342000FA
MDRVALGEFLRSRRARVGPAEVGLVGGGRRQTPGLRREEVALLAGISVDYYVRLEQGRGPQPSDQVVGALADALRLTGEERDYLLRLVHPGRIERTGEVPGSVLRLLGRLGDVPAMVIDGCYDVVAVNGVMTALVGEGRAPRNMLRWLFDESDFRDGHKRELARRCVADLRAGGRYPRDVGVKRLVDGLMADSPEFARVWAAGDVGVQRSLTKRTVHPVVGELELDCEILDVPGTDHRVILYTAEPGTPTHEALRRL